MNDIYEVIDKAATARVHAGYAFEPGEDVSFAVRELARAVEELGRIVAGLIEREGTR